MKKSAEEFQLKKFGPEGEIYRKQNELLKPVLSKIDDAIQKAGSHPLVVNYSIVISNKSSDEIPSLIEKSKTPAQPFNKQSKLHNRYIFDNFIEGNGNQFAKAAASSVADGPGQTPFNPLLIYSNPGLGKTHLIQAIGNHIVKHHPNLKVIYVTSEKFMLDFIYSIQNVFVYSGYHYRNGLWWLVFARRDLFWPFEWFYMGIVSNVLSDRSRLLIKVR